MEKQGMKEARYSLFNLSSFESLKSIKDGTENKLLQQHNPSFQTKLLS